jgi:hypothetical protein
MTGFHSTFSEVGNLGFSVPVLPKPSFKELREKLVTTAETTSDFEVVKILLDHSVLCIDRALLSNPQIFSLCSGSDNWYAQVVTPLLHRNSDNQLFLEWRNNILKDKKNQDKPSVFEKVYSGSQRSSTV